MNVLVEAPHYIFKSVTLLSPTKSLVTFARDGELVEIQISAERLNEDLCIVSCSDRVYNQDLVDDKDLMRIDQAMGSFFWLNDELEKIESGECILKFDLLKSGSSSEFVFLFGTRKDLFTCSFDLDGKLQLKDGQALPEALANEELKSALTSILLRIIG